MANKANSKFKRGSGAYNCTSCTRKTRATGGDNDSLRLCFECYEIGGYENQLQDGRYDDAADQARIENEIKRLQGVIVEKGGKL